MKTFFRILLVMISACLPYAVQAAAAPVPAATPRVLLSPATPGPGDIVVVAVKGVEGPVEGTFGDKKLHFNPSGSSYTAVFGVDLYTEPGIYNLDISAGDKVLSRPVKVKSKKFPVQRLTLPDDMVELTPENEARVDREQKKMAAIWPGETERTHHQRYSQELPQRG
jgi:hypothetical protein